MLRNFWVLDFLKTIPATPNSVASPNGVIYDSAKSIIYDLVSDTKINAGFGPGGKAAHTAGSAAQAFVYFNRKNGRWTMLVQNTPYLYAVTNWTGTLLLATYNSQQLQWNIGAASPSLPAISSSSGTYARTVQAWLSEKEFAYVDTNGNLQFLDITTLGSTQAISTIGQFDYAAPGDGWAYMDLNSLPGPGAKYDASANPGPGNFGGAMYGVANSETYFDLLVRSKYGLMQAGRIKTGTSFNASHILQNSTVWENNEVIPTVYVNLAPTTTALVYCASILNGQLAFVLWGTAGNADVYLPRAAPRPWSLMSVPKLVNFSRPISLIGEFKA